MFSHPDLLARPHATFQLIKAPNECGAVFKSLSDPSADTTSPHGYLMLTVLGSLAEFERLSANELVRVRRVRRCSRLQKKPPTPYPHDFGSRTRKRTLIGVHQGCT